jgi:hypothetical protein
MIFNLHGSAQPPPIQFEFFLLAASSPDSLAQRQESQQTVSPTPTPDSLLLTVLSYSTAVDFVGRHCALMVTFFHLRIAVAGTLIVGESVSQTLKEIPVMISNRLIVKVISLYGLLFALASAASAAGSIRSGPIQFPQIPPPLSVTWQLATVEGQFVSATWSGFEPPLPISQRSVTAENAAAFGIDFNAWAQAVVDPAFTRSIVIANGIRQEGPLERFGEVQKLDLLHFRTPNKTM